MAYHSSSQLAMMNEENTYTSNSREGNAIARLQPRIHEKEKRLHACSLARDFSMRQRAKVLPPLLSAQACNMNVNCFIQTLLSAQAST